MKIKHLILLTTTAVAASSLSSCKEEPYIITAEEEYTRNFIKEFGLIDPKQDWNLAEGSNVTVKVGSTPAEVKAYMKVDNTYYLVANLKDVAGDVKIPFDMPEGTTDIMVKINGKRYYTTPGGTVDPNNVASRTLNTAGGPGVTIKLLPDDREDGGVNYLSIDPKDILKFTEVLEENYNPCRTPESTNLIIQQKAITENFVAKAKSFWIFPEIWDTNNWCNNTIGIYYYAQEGATGAEKIVDINGNERWVVKAPIYVPVPRESDDESQKVSIVDNLFTVTGTIVNLINSWATYYEKVFDYLMIQYEKGLLPDGWELAIADGTESYKDQHNDTFNSGAKLLRRSADEKFFNFLYVTNSIKDEESAKIIYNATYKVYPKFNTEFHYTPDYWYITGVDPSTFKEEVVYHQQPKYLSPTFFKSKGIEITFNQEVTFGFYIERGGNTKFSEAKYNESLYHNDEFVTQACYVCTFTQGTDTYGNTLRRLCFEDWFTNATVNEDGTPGSDVFGDMTNFDMNDMVFRVYGFDEIVSHKDVEVGSIEDPDNPTTTEVDEPYQWLLAVEDLGATDDFDFNDIIIGITAELVVEADLPSGARTVGYVISNATQGDVTGNCWNKVTFTALAAGGTLPTYIFYGEEQLYPDGKLGRAEWHKWFGDGTISSGTMINTGHGNDNQKGETCTIYFGADNYGKFLFSVDKLGVRDKYSTDAKNSGFKVGIDKAGETSYASDYIDHDYFTKGEDGYFVKPSNPGEAPQMFLIPDRWNKNGDNTGTSTYDTGKWQWPTERTHIQDSYSRFGAWVKNASDASNWYKDTGKSVCRPTAK